MPLADLSPQLRTRLSRMERAVGVFVLIAAGLLLFGFIYYVYHTAERKGWFKRKAPFFTFTDRATGLKEGDPVTMMGFQVGSITRIDAQPPWDVYDVYVEFDVLEPYEGYIWTEGSRAKVATADLLGKRELQISKGTNGYPIYMRYPFRIVPTAEARLLPDWEKWKTAEDIYDPSGTNRLAKALAPLPSALPAAQSAGLSQLRVFDSRVERKGFTAVWADKEGAYTAYTRTNKPYWLVADESPAVTERMEKLVDEVERALPNFLALTNQLTLVLSNGVELTSNLNAVALSANPVASNLATLTAHFDQPGKLGEWLLPTNINQQLEGTLADTRSALASLQKSLSGVDTNLTVLAENLGRSLDNLADITSNLNHQVAVNTNILSEISGAVRNTDDLVQGLKRHWLLRSAFKSSSSKTNQPGPSSVEPLRSPKDRTH